jgi:O-acetyl-ADP-ribose deacetylase (regulator of RNase III)
MINYVTGDLFASLPDQPIVIAHICNNIGRFGGGFTGPLGRKWPIVEQRYKNWHNTGNDTSESGFGKSIRFGLGQTQFIRVQEKPLIVVANMIAQKEFPTAKEPDAVHYDALRQCIRTVSHWFDPKEVELHCPKFGSGIGGGDWQSIEPMIEDFWIRRGFKVTIYTI